MVLNIKMNISLKKIIIAEIFGTFWIVFAGTGAMIVNDMTGMITHLGIALVFGLIVFAMISTLGDISGAHLNPAVTIAFFVAKRFPGNLVFHYILSQCAGAILASLLLFTLFPEHKSLGGTFPSGGIWQSWIFEFILTFGLMFVVLNVSTGAKEKGITAGLAIGSVVALEALFAGPVCGASMNPARSLGPAVISGNLNVLWIYLTAPVFGAIAAVFLCCQTREAGCCGQVIKCEENNE